MEGQPLLETRQRDPRGPGTIRMAERLQKLAQQVHPMNTIFLSDECVKLLQAELATTTDPNQRHDRTFALASEPQNAGQNPEALRQLEELQKTLKALHPHRY